MGGGGWDFGKVNFLLLHILLMKTIFPERATPYEPKFLISFTKIVTFSVYYIHIFSLIIAMQPMLQLTK